MFKRDATIILKDDDMMYEPIHVMFTSYICYI